jgi:glycosyltransferase involved in cell wall biosynthesis
MAVKVSVYVPCYNAEATIGMCLASLLAQRRPPDEIIVVDDASTDQTQAIAKRFGVRVARHQVNMGLSAARNTGVRAATGDLVASIDSDCTVDPLWLATLLRLLEQNPGLVGAAGKLVEAEKWSVADRWRAHHLPQHHGPRRVLDPRFLFGANTLFRRQALLDAKLYPRRLRTNGEDYEMSRRLMAAHPRPALIYDPAALAFHHKRDTVASVIRTYWRYQSYYWWHLKPQRTLREFAAMTGKLCLDLLRNHTRNDVRGRRWGGLMISLLAVGWVVALQIGRYRDQRRSNAAEQARTATQP